MRTEQGVNQSTGLSGMAHMQKITMESFVTAIQKRLDTFASTKTYDNMLSLCTYATSNNPVFSREGQYGVEVRDATWAKANEIMGAVMMGQRPAPTWEELEAELPELKWPALA